MAFHTVKIFGERNTATNALGRIVTDNSASEILPSTEYDIDPDASRRAWAEENRKNRERALDDIYSGVPDTSAWKHAATNFDDVSSFEGTLVLFCLKNPASWLTSLFRNPYHALVDLPDRIADFVDVEWPTPARERLGEATFRPLELYNAKIRCYLEMADRLDSAHVPYLFIRQEDLLLNPSQAIRPLAPLLDRPRRRFRTRSRSAKNGWMPIFFTRRYYARERWRQQLDGLEPVINAEVDWSAIQPFGYEPLTA